MAELIPYHTILAAKAGDSDALEQILFHYDKLIAQYATRSTHDTFGNSYEMLDHDMKMRIAADLTYQIIYNFDPLRLPPGEVLEE